MVAALGGLRRGPRRSLRGSLRSGCGRESVPVTIVERRERVSGRRAVKKAWSCFGMRPTCGSDCARNCHRCRFAPTFRAPASCFAAHGRCARQGRATFLEAARKVQLGERTEKHYSGLVIILRCSIRQLLAARLLPFAVQGVARPGLRWRSSMSMEGTGLC